MVRDRSRRGFLSGLGGLLALGVPTVSASLSTERFIVDLRSTADHELRSLDVIHRLDEIDLAVVRGSKSDVSGLSYTRDLDIEVIDPSVVSEPYTGPSELPAGESHPNAEDAATRDGVTDALNEPLYNIQWDKHAQEIADVQRYHRGEGTRVAIIDSGVYDGHPNLEHAVRPDLSKNFTEDDGDHNPYGAGDHGTHVAGIVAGNDRNDEGMVGTAPGAEIVSCRVFSSKTSGAGDIFAAIVHSANVGCDVANLSLGAYPLPRKPPIHKLKAMYERAASYALSQGTLPIAAAGNDGARLDPETGPISLPNQAEGFMSISATGPIGYRWDDDEHDGADPITGWGGLQRMSDALYRVSDEPSSPAVYTNYGAEATDLSAPGGDIDLDIARRNRGEDSPYENIWDWQYDSVLSTTVEETESGYEPGYGWKAGTSMAAPNVAGTAALVKAKYPSLSPTELREHLVATAEDVGSATYHGNGHLNTEAALETRPVTRTALGGKIRRTR